MERVLYHAGRFRVIKLEPDYPQPYSPQRVLLLFEDMPIATTWRLGDSVWPGGRRALQVEVTDKYSEVSLASHGALQTTPEPIPYLQVNPWDDEFAERWRAAVAKFLMRCLLWLRDNFLPADRPRLTVELGLDINDLRRIGFEPQNADAASHLRNQAPE